MRFDARFIAVALIGLTASGCGGLKDDLGLAKKAPDEFAVVRNAPLSLPPNFNLRPPKPGEVGDGRLEQRDQARALLVSGSPGATRAQTAAATALTTASAPVQPASYSFVAGRVAEPLGAIDDHRLIAAAPSPSGTLVASNTTAPLPSDPGERALLGRLNATNTDPNIRRRVDEEARVLAADDRNIVERMMFWRTLNPPGVIVDADAEARRINENQALGQSVTQGETPEIRVERLSSGFSGIKLF